jgi:hypothetical protein
MGSKSRWVDLPRGFRSPYNDAMQLTKRALCGSIEFGGHSARFATDRKRYANADAAFAG